jgi:hypothetical protein
MPYKERYWRDPEKHRAEVHNRYKRLQALGMSRKEMRSEQAQKNWLEYDKKWRRAHKDANRKAVRKYYAKIVRLFGNGGPVARWKYQMLRKEQNAAKRKSLAKTPPVLPRKLVESTRRTNMVSGRKRSRIRP